MTTTLATKLATIVPTSFDMPDDSAVDDSVALAAALSAADISGSALKIAPAAAAASLSSPSQVSVSGSGLVFQNSFSLDGTFSSLTANEQSAIQTDVEQAETNLSRQFGNTLTANIDFEVVNDSTIGSGAFIATNQATFFYNVTYANYLGALQRAATTAYQSSAIAAIQNLTDLGTNPTVVLPAAYARMLGLTTSGTLEHSYSVQLGGRLYNLSSFMDDSIFLNLAFLKPTLDLQTANTPNDSIVATIEHEITENTMGRTAALEQYYPSQWAPTDFFRVTGSGQSYLKPNASIFNAVPIYFSPTPGVGGPISSLQFGNSSNFNDWIETASSDTSVTDPFGPGDFSDPYAPSQSSVLSPTDLDLMSVLGWTFLPIQGAVASQATNEIAPISPFTNVTIVDSDIGQSSILTVTLSSPGNGILSNLGGGSYNASTGSYTVYGSATTVTAALRGLVFNPTVIKSTTGQTVTTGFTIRDYATSGSTISNTTTSVVVTVPAATTIETFGSTSLFGIGTQFYLFPIGTGSDISLQSGGNPLTPALLGAWTPIGAEQIAGGYEVAFKNSGTNQFVVWNTDAAGDCTTSPTAGAVFGSDLGLETLETSFQQDLNGDGTVGPPPPTPIESFGTTILMLSAGQYLLNPIGGGTGPTLKSGGRPLTSTQLGVWTPIGAEQISGGYEVAFKNASTSQFVVWDTDTSGNCTASPTGAVSGSDIGLETLETSFQQDLNGDGTIGVPPPAPIESFGATILALYGNQYLLNPVAGGTGPTLKSGGNPLTSTQLGAWTPIGAEQISGGYEVAFENIATYQFVVWDTDVNGNCTISPTGAVSGSDAVLALLEPSFHEDLNSDGWIGFPVLPTLIEASGATLLARYGNEYLLDPDINVFGPILKNGGKPLTSTQLGAWTPIGAEQISGGYEVAFKNTSTSQFVVWDTDTNGNCTTSPTGSVYSQNFALEELEPSFQQDLNGDGFRPAILLTGTAGGDTLDLTGESQTAIINLGGNTASASVGLSAPSLTFIGTPDAITLSSVSFGAVIEYGLTASSGIETIANFRLGWELLNIDLLGAASSTLMAYDTTVGGAHAIAITSSTDPLHGVVLLGMGYSAAGLLANDITFVNNHALIH